MRRLRWHRWRYYEAPDGYRRICTRPGCGRHQIAIFDIAYGRGLGRWTDT